MALATTQWEYGCLTDHVRERALAVIGAGADLHRWEDANGRKQRAAMCEALAVKLRSEQPRRRRPRARRQIDDLSNTVVAPDGVTSATAFSIPGIPNRMQVTACMTVKGECGGGSICVGSANYDAITLEWLDNRTLRITHPVTMEFEQRHKTSFFYGEEITVHYQPAEG